MNKSDQKNQKLTYKKSNINDFDLQMLKQYFEEMK